MIHAYDTGLVARIREVEAALRANQPLHPTGPAYPALGVGMSSEEFTHAQMLYNAYAVGVLTSLATSAADLLEMRP